MALNPSSHANATASHSAIRSAQHGASKLKPTLSADDADDAGGFAAQLLRAQPKEGGDLQASDADLKSDANRKTAKDEDDEDDDSTSAKPADARQAAADPTALPLWQPVATTSLADKPTQPAADAELTDDPLGALRKAASAGKGKTGKEALLGAADAKGAQPSDPAALVGKGELAAGDMAAALAKAQGAANAATGTRDSMAALLPQPDPLQVQAGTVGAPTGAPLDANAGAPVAPPPQAQATLEMPPQSPAFMPALGRQIEVWMKGGVQHAEVQLNPLDLGPIRVKIEMAGAQARVEMSADVQSTRDALQQAMPQLSASLGEVGLSLTGGGVSDQPTFQQQQSQAQAQAGADERFGGSGGRSGRAGGLSGADAGGREDFAVASAARQAAQRRGLLDLYA
jgi:flagellar hook-length control protein FliK